MEKKTWEEKERWKKNLSFNSTFGLLLNCDFNITNYRNKTLNKSSKTCFGRNDLNATLMTFNPAEKNPDCLDKKIPGV